MEITKQRVVYEIPGMSEAVVRRGVRYSAADADPLTLDLYYPKGDESGRSALLPAVVIVLGYPDAAGPTPFGCQFREMGMIVSWCQLFAASGMVGVVYETKNPAADVHSVLACLKENGPALGIDKQRIGVWAGSGNAPGALSALMDGKTSCGVLFYPMTLDLDGGTSVARSASMFRFANPTAERRVEDLPSDTALFIARAGKDQFAGLNEALDRFVPAAVRCNLPVTFVNHSSGSHGFDYADDNDESRRIVRAALDFLRAKLR